MVDAIVSDEHPVLLFVYGTLMTGYGNNHILGDSRCLGRAHTADTNFAMLNGGVPFVRQTSRDGTRIAGEIFAVSSLAVLDAVDRLEGHPDWYCRTPVVCILDGDPSAARLHAQIYLNDSPLLDDGTLLPIPSGDFRDAAAPATK